jgi:hypothetical protein
MADRNIIAVYGQAYSKERSVTIVLIDFLLRRQIYSEKITEEVKQKRFT